MLRKKLRLQVYKNWLCSDPFYSQGVGNKDPTFYLYGERPANTCIPTSFSGKASVLSRGLPTLKRS